MSKIRLNNLKFIILIWCICLLTKSVYLSSIKNYQNDEDTTNKLKNILLRKLDLEEEPTNLGDTNVPNYLLDLFETNSLFQNNRILLINNSNTIRSHPMLNYEISQKSTKGQTASAFLIKFNMTLPNKEILNASELRLFLNNTISLCASHKQRVTINQIIQQLVKSNQTDRSTNQQFINQFINDEDENQIIYRLIDTLVVEQDESKWLQFDVQPAVESWIKQISTNFGLLIKSQCVNQNDSNLNEDQFIDNLVFQSTNDQIDSLKPVLLTYSNFQNMEYDIDNMESMNKKKRHINQNEPLTAVQSRNDWRTGKTKDCTRHSMYVDFNEIGWSDWVISPKGYDAYLCYGDCSMSVIRNGNSSNHATMQSLSNGIQPDIVPPPCCVPTEYAPITMIYKDRDQLILKIYEEMIVTRCGCR